MKDFHAMMNSMATTRYDQIHGYNNNKTLIRDINLAENDSRDHSHNEKNFGNDKKQKQAKLMSFFF